MLEFQKALLKELISQDGLLIMPRGLGMDQIIAQILKAYSDPQHLVFIINAFHEEEIAKLLETMGQILPKNKLPKTINTEYNQKERKQIYLNGGAFFITSRILIVDILSNRIPDNLVSGILLLNAHKLNEDSNEVFIIKFLKQKNKRLFIKAFSEHEYPFSYGFLKLQKMVDLMYLEKVYLWPRFRKEVVESLQNHSPEVVEVTCKLSKNMKLIQDSITDLIKKSIEEVKKHNQENVDFYDLDMDNFLLKSFDYKLKQILSPHWDKIGKRTKGLLEDIRLMKRLLEYLLRNDCYTFWNYLENLAKQQEQLDMPTSNWILTDSANIIFLSAKERVYLTKNSIKKLKKEEQTKEKVEDGLSLVLEENPKWSLISKILSEIKASIAKSKDPLLNGKVLILTKTENCCTRIQEYLDYGGREMMLKIFNHHHDAQEKRNQFNQEAGQSSATPVKKRPNDNGPISPNNIFTKISPPKSISVDLTSEKVDKTLTIMIKPYFNINLEEIKPSWVILYEGEISVVRSLELFKSCHPGFPMRIYFLRYESSIEEEVYKNSIRSEIKNYKKLIEENSRLVPTEKTLDLIKPIESGASGKSKVIVDIREFRGTLPSALHQNGFEVIPLSITVGDFILTPKLCIERKSTSDLISSLTGGRLYQQAERMLKYYENAGVLIQFEEGENFELIPVNDMREKVQGGLVTSKLTLCTIHFPRLKIFWTKSPKHSVQLISNLKKNQEEPDPVVAQSVGENTIEENSSESAIDFLKKLPGINPQNINIVLNNVKSLRELSNMKYADLVKLIGKQNAYLLFDFLNQDYFGK